MSMNSWCESTRAADAWKMLEAEADACLPRSLVDQQRIGLDVADIAGIGALDPADVGIIGL